MGGWGVVDRPARVLGALLVPLHLVTAAMSVHLAWLTSAAWWAVRRGQHRTDVGGQATTRFVVLVPAHDEERLLPDTLRSIAAVDYPATLLDVHVVADHCTDATVAVARAHGVTVHERSGATDPGKGPALTWALDRVGDAHDVVVVIDADTVVDVAFLRVLDARFRAGARVVQGHYAVRDPGTSPAVGLRTAALAARHYVRPLARSSTGCSAGLMGNGMAFAKEVVADRGWSGHLVEDLELEAKLLAEGERVVFAPDARVEAEMPARLDDARLQNERWERGRADVARTYGLRYLRELLDPDRRSRVRADAALDYLQPPLSALFAGTLALATAAGTLARVRPGPARHVGARLGALCLVLQVGYVVTGLRMVGVPPRFGRSLLALPGFVLWKLGVLRRVASSAEVGWTRTERNR